MAGPAARFEGGRSRPAAKPRVVPGRRAASECFQRDTDMTTELVPIIAVVAVVALAFARHRAASGRRRPSDELPATNSRLDRIEQAVDGIALQVERVGEGQRYVTKVLSNQARVEAPADQPAPRAQEREPS